MPRVVLLAVVLAVGAPFAGCAATGSTNDSSGNFKGEERLVANTVEDLQSAGSKGNEADICETILTRSLARQMGAGGGGCAKAVDATLKDTDSFDLKVESVRVRGTRATARVKADRGDRDEIVTLGLAKEGQGWRISDLG